MREKLENDSTCFEKLSLTITEYKKSRIHSKEIIVNGKMYDVKSVIFTGDSVKLLAINDIEEGKIVQMIKELVNGISSPKNKVPGHLKLIIFLKYIFPGTNHFPFIPAYQISLIQYFNPDFLTNNPEILTPPPKFVQ